MIKVCSEQNNPRVLSGRVWTQPCGSTAGLVLNGSTGWCSMVQQVGAQRLNSSTAGLVLTCR